MTRGSELPNIRLVADVHISPATVSDLQKAGYVCGRVDYVLSAKAADTEVIRWARSNGRVIVTQDLDFSALVAQPGQKGPSVVTLRLAKAFPAAVSQALLASLPSLENTLLQGALVTIEETQVRVRELPVRLPS